MKIAYKYKNVLKYIEAKDIRVGTTTLEALMKEQENLKALFNNLIKELDNHHIVKKDTSYIIKIGEELKRIDKLELVEDTNTKLPLGFYEIKDGKIVLNKKKAGAL